MWLTSAHPLWDRWHHKSVCQETVPLQGREARLALHIGQLKFKMDKHQLRCFHGESHDIICSTLLNQFLAKNLSHQWFFTTKAIMIFGNLQRIFQQWPQVLRIWHPRMSWLIELDKDQLGLMHYYSRLCKSGWQKHLQSHQLTFCTRIIVEHWQSKRRNRFPLIAP